MKIKINGRFFDHFNDLKINLSLDKFASTFSFKSRFDKNNPRHREIFRPLSYPKVEIYTDQDDLLITGTLVNNGFTSSKNPKLISVSGYSKSGILEDVSIPLSAYPLEKNNQTLKEISSQLISEFGINQIIDPIVLNELNLTYEKVVASPNDSVAGFLSRLAAQRNVIIGHTRRGDIYYFKALLNQKAIRFFNQNNVLESSISVNGRGFHSEITVQRQPSENNEGVATVDTVKNNLVSERRSLTKILSSGEDTDVSKAANNVMASELKSIKLDFTLPKIDYALKCGQLIEFQNEDLFIFRRNKFVISEINYSQNKDSEVMNLSCLIPESFTGDQPKNIFQV